jgi:hypothetical protein
MPSGQFVPVTTQCQVVSSQTEATL